MISNNSEQYAHMTPDGHLVHSEKTHLGETSFYGKETPCLKAILRIEGVTDMFRGRIKNYLPELQSGFSSSGTRLPQPSFRSSLAQLSLDGRIIWESLEFKRDVMSVVSEIVAPSHPEIIKHLYAFLSSKKQKHQLLGHPLEVSRIFIPGEQSALSKDEIEKQIREKYILFNRLQSISSEGIVNQKSNNFHYKLPNELTRDEFLRFFIGSSGRNELQKIQQKSPNNNSALIKKGECFISDVTINTGNNYGVLATDFRDDAGRLCHQTPSHLDPGSINNRQIEITPLEKNIRQKNVRVHWQMHRAHPSTQKRSDQESL